MSARSGSFQPHRCVLDCWSSIPFIHAADQLHASQPNYFNDCAPYTAVGCVALSLHLGEVVDGWDWGDQGGGLQDRELLAFDICRTLLHTYGNTLAGPASAPNRTQWGRVAWLDMVVKPGEEAQGWLVATTQAQALEVEVRGAVVAVPARGIAARLPPGHVQVTFRGLPYFYARPGFTAAMLAAAEYSVEQGVVVVHERAGIVLGPTGEGLGAPSLDVVVAVVRTPVGDPTLQHLPGEFRLGRHAEVRVTVEGCVEHGLRLSLRPPPGQQPAGPRREGTLRRVYAQHGITPEVLAAATPLVADVVGQHAQRPGSQIGLGFVRAEGVVPATRFVREGAGTSPALPPPPPPPAPRPAAEFPMPTAGPLLAVPLDEPVIGAAVEYVQDCCAEVSQEDAERVVMAVRTFHPDLYQACMQAGRVGDLSHAFRFVLSSQAAGILGVEVAALLQPTPVDGERGDSEAGEEGDGWGGEEMGGSPGALEAGRAAAACLPAGVLASVGSDGEEDVGAGAGSTREAVVEEDDERMSVEGGEGAFAPPHRPPTTRRAPIPVTPQDRTHHTRGKARAPSPGRNPYPARPGRGIPGAPYWQVQHTSSVQVATPTHRTPQLTATQSPPTPGSGRQRQ